MTSKLTRERLQEIAEDGFLKRGESKELARMALAAMDSEPVAWTWHHLKQWHVTNDEERARDLAWDGVKVEPLYRHAQPAPVVQCPFPCGWDNLNKLAIQDAALVARGLVEGEPTTEAHRQAAILNNDRLLKVISACRAAMLQPLHTIKAASALGSLPKTGEVLHTNSPIIPDGYVMVPMRLTAENGAKGVLSGEFSETQFVNCPECFGDDECETCDGSGRIEITVPVTWTTIKEIWAKGVEHFAAAPQDVPDGK